MWHLLHCCDHWLVTAATGVFKVALNVRRKKEERILKIIIIF